MLKTIVSKLPEYRKGVIAVVAAFVTVAHAFGFPVADDLSTEIVAVFDSVAAILLILVPNA